jgi:hypothetical protein
MGRYAARLASALITCLLAAPLPAAGAAAGRIPRVGVLRPGSPPDAYDEAFRQGLRELG